MDDICRACDKPRHSYELFPKVLLEDKTAKRFWFVFCEEHVRLILTNQWMPPREMLCGDDERNV